MNKKNSKTQRKHWEAPWGYAESFFIGIGLLLTGFMLEITIGVKGLDAIVYPYNIIALVSFILFLIAIYFFALNNIFVQWLTSIPASITSLVLITFLVMIMGIIPQSQAENEFVLLFGLNHITSNWAFVFILIFFLSCLGIISIKRIAQFKLSNLGFILNHTGLFIALVAGTLGVGDLQRLTLQVNENEANFIALDKKNNEIELDFAVFLKDFNIEEYNPKLALVDNASGEVVDNNGKSIYLIKKGEKYSFKNYTVEILEYLESSSRFGNEFYKVNELGSPPSAKIKVTNNKTNETTTNWISCGSFTHQYSSLKVSEDYSIVMTIPETKKFASDIEILTKEGKRIPAVLEVNKPLSYDGWELYQYSYDDKKGKWSSMSIIELVRDPWLPVVYLGIFMMIFGSLYILWVGSKISKSEKYDLD